MANNGTSNARRPDKRGGKFIPALFNVVGTLLLLAVIVTVAPISVPRMLGYEVYHVETGSMEPTLPVGSAVYVKATEPETLEPGDIIAFYNLGMVVTHRVTENRKAEGELQTKGDANNLEDLNPIPYGNVIGKVEYHVPMLGGLLIPYSDRSVKLYLLCVAAAGLLLHMIAGRIRNEQEEEYRRELERWKRMQAARRAEEAAKERRPENR